MSCIPSTEVRCPTELTSGSSCSTVGSCVLLSFNTTSLWLELISLGSGDGWLYLYCFLGFPSRSAISWAVIWTRNRDPLLCFCIFVEFGRLVLFGEFYSITYGRAFWLCICVPLVIIRWTYADGCNLRYCFGEGPPLGERLISELCLLRGILGTEPPSSSVLFSMEWCDKYICVLVAVGFLVFTKGVVCYGAYDWFLKGRWLSTIFAGNPSVLLLF